uniref:Uncharacterized protein n=1 Tax=Ciona intestinalis TaxID=7719 RepID=H2XSZ7_CIOIN|nr:uncharacterized protein C4orf45-like [Ciona intestinalis]|eukprot:XP_002127922.1 uncharacterized protein C4orf45-like [Ciona intestinalis]
MGVIPRPVQSACSSRTSGSSGSIDDVTKRYNYPSSIKPTGRRMLYTGPSGALNHRVKVEEQGRYIGIAPLSREITSGAEYLYRPCTSSAPKCEMRHKRVGEIGWNVTTLLRNSVLPVVISPGRR